MNYSRAATDAHTSGLVGHRLRVHDSWENRVPIHRIHRSDSASPPRCPIYPASSSARPSTLTSTCTLYSIEYLLTYFVGQSTHPVTDNSRRSSTTHPELPTDEEIFNQSIKLTPPLSCGAVCRRMLRYSHRDSDMGGNDGGNINGKRAKKRALMKQ